MKKPIFIAGPTGTGKTSVSVRITKKNRGEIISVDSMQVYRGLDIGTAKPTKRELESVPHHLIDVVEPTENFDASTFVEMAGEAAKRITTPIFCGGTGLYFKAWLEGLGQAPGGDAHLREKLEDIETEALLDELLEKDPDTHQEIDHKNRRRLVRAVEVIRLTGRPFSAQRAIWKREVPPNFFILQRESEDLRQRIDRRVDQMFVDGLVEETRSLLSALESNRTAQQAIGYRQVIGHLRGERDLRETVALVKSRTWQYARRQQTWFRKMTGAIRIEMAPDESPAATTQRIIDLLV